MKWLSIKRGEMLIVSFVVTVCLLAGASSASSSSPYEWWSREEMVEMAGYGEEKLSTVVIAGSLECQARLHGDARYCSSPISGALVAVKCHTNGNGRGRAVWSRAITDEYGEFLVDLPSHLHSIPHLQHKCLLRVLRVPKKSKCRPASPNIRKRLTLSSFGNCIRTYTSGTIRLQYFVPSSSLACV